MGHFPMTGEKFSKAVEARLVRVKEKIGTALTAHKVSDADKVKVLKEFDDGAVAVRAAAKRVGTDGTVTRDEAKEVRGLTKALGKQLRSKYLPKTAADKPAPKPAGAKDV